MNIRGRLKRASIILLLMVPAICLADVYKPSIISDIDTVEYKHEKIKLNDRDIEYSISYQSNYSALYETHNPDRLTYLLKDSWILLKGFMDENNLSSKDCRDDYNINIFILDRNTMYDAQRFKKYFNTYKKPETIVWGYYSSTLEIERESTILLTDISDSLNEVVFAHEIAHYWWDRLCMGREWPEDTEHFAMAFERYYRDKR